MSYENYKYLRIKLDSKVLFVTIDNPPINLLDLNLMSEIDQLGREVEVDDNISVLVFDSANPDFFIAHADVNMILLLPTDVPPKGNTLGFFHAMVDRFRTMPKVSIAKIEGFTRGGGSEFALSLDMRFGALGHAVFCQPEVAFGIIPGGSGTQRLPRIMGRARALEIVLGCDDFPADLAERYGYINRALSPEEIGPFVESLAYRIATFPPKAIALAKASVNSAELPIVEGLIEEAHYFNQSVATDTAQMRMKKLLELGGQTSDVEIQPIVSQYEQFLEALTASE
ncbi:MAG: enoyl-CoA hydratase/isomerase family protein [Dehalococcoidia bacterium]|nr:enoyl-CoA hydratase/isomerase family protein [Dehalococcoidia bacterium]